jgi:hypothetical protein
MQTNKLTFEENVKKTKIKTYLCESEKLDENLGIFSCGLSQCQELLAVVDIPGWERSMFS